ncbi:MAG: tyrosine-type recombinase/integrase [Hyphomicrobiaceae bacterium]|nr:tyrosine-type recombinase/integrase [Hyphomicrobiaceae bacterium]
MPGLVKRDGRYLYRRRYPKDVAATLGKDEHVVYIGRLSNAAAEVRAHAAGLDFAATVAKARAGDPNPISALRDALLNTYAMIPTNVPIPANTVIPLGHPAYPAVARKILAEEREAKAAAKRKLADIVEIWIERKNPRRAAIRRMRMWADRFVNVTKCNDVAKVEQRHVAAFIAYVERQPYTRVTAAQGVSSLRTLWKHALSRNLVERNPWIGVGVAMENVHEFTVPEPEGFSPAEVRLILANLGQLSPNNAWMLRMMIFHGARASDLADMWRRDVLPDRFTMDGEIKNHDSARAMPLHPECLGFYEYVHKCTKKDDDPVWYGKDPANHAQQKFTKFFRGLGLKTTAHGARHTFIATAIRAGVPEYVHKAMVGHARGRDAHSRYGTPCTYADKAKWLPLIRPDLD